MGEIFNKSYADYSSKRDAEREFASFKFKWIERVAVASELSPLAVRLCILFLHYFNIEFDGAAWPSQDTLADKLVTSRDLPTHRATINKLINELVEHGHLFKKRGQRSSTYHMVLKEPAEEASRCDELATSGEANQESNYTSDVVNSLSRCGELATESSSINSGTASLSPEKKTAAAAAGSGDPASASLRPPPRKGRKKGSRGGVGHPPGGAPGDEATRRAGFAEIQAAHPRPYADDAEKDYRAYCRALQFIDHDTLRAKHAAYVKATVEGEGAQYLKSLAVWFDRHGWEKPLPSHKANGNGRRRSDNGARRSRSDGATVRDELHEKLAERMRRKEAMQ